jgi:hypothetical protein
VVGGLALGDQTLVTLSDGDQGVLNLPLADVAEGLTTDGSLLGSFRGCPPFRPVLCELFNEWRFDRTRLYIKQSVRRLEKCVRRRTVNVGLGASDSEFANAPEAARAKTESATLRMVVRRAG